MSTRLTDVIVPEVFSPYVKERMNTTSKLIASGGVAQDPMLSAFLSGGGATFEIPGWKSKDGVIFNADNDNPADTVTPDKVTAGSQIAARLSQNYHVGSGRFTTALAGSNPLEAVASDAASIYNANRQAHLVASLDGMFAVGGALESEIITSSTWTSDVLIDAEGLFEDFTSGTGLLIVDSTTFSAMRKENLVDSKALGEQGIVMPDYLGYSVLVDNKLGEASAYVIKQAAVRLGTGTVFSSAYEAETQGNGAGVEYLRMLDEYMLHVDGMKWKGGVNPNASALSTPANWEATYDMKHIGIKRIDIGA